MKPQQCTFATALLLAMVSVPWRLPAQAPGAAHETSPMTAFARMVGGAWQVTFQSGKSQRDTWQWGPGRHSMRLETTGYGAAGEPWRALEVVFWHPGHQQVRVLGVSPYAQGVMDGSMRFEGETGYADFDIFQPSGRRTMHRRWAFQGPETYVMTLWDRTHAPVFAPIGDWNQAPAAERDHAPLGEWTYVRTETGPGTDPRVARGDLPSTKHFGVFSSLVDRTWTAKADRATGEAVDLESTFEWVPHADYVYARSIARAQDGSAAHRLDAYFYFHPESGGLRCLALTQSGGVYEGDLTVLDGGAVQLDLSAYEGDGMRSYVVRLDIGEGGTLRDRRWLVRGADRTLVRDISHAERKP